MTTFKESVLPVPDSIRDNQTVGAGISSWVFRLDAVAKCYTADNDKDREREVAVYERLGLGNDPWPETILKYYGKMGDLVLLEFAPHGTIRSYLRSQRKVTPLSVKLRWARQAAEGISLLHSKGILHCDIACNNIFLDKNLNGMVGDFAGSSIDGEPCLVWYQDGHHHPDTKHSSEQSDIFALGSTFYELIVGQKPTTETLIGEGAHLHTLESLPALGAVIFKCWNGQYRTVDDLLKDVQQEDQSSPRSVLRMGEAFALVIAAAVPVLYWMRMSRLQRT